MTNISIENEYFSLKEEIPGLAHITRKDILYEYEDLGCGDALGDGLERIAKSFIETICSRFNLDYNRADDDYVWVNISELLTNAEEKGNKLLKGTKITLAYTVIEKKWCHIFKVTICDEGKGHDYEFVQHCEKDTRGTDISLNHFRDMPKSKFGSRGHGLFHVIRNSESVSWNKKGNEITICQKLHKCNTIS
jgi:anti-sigma regulatory factor (Ser/Thr protein kinase)